MSPEELVIDSFAGGGGASYGIEEALGRPVDVAINHKPEAIEMHRANHPHTRHYTEDVFKVRPREVTHGRPVGLLWMSPDCKFFSRAKGSSPVSERVRGLAWMAVTWAKTARPRVIILENVREFEEWGPCVPRWVCGKCTWKGTEGQVSLVRSKRACPRCESRRVRATADRIPDPARKGVTFRQFVGRLKALGYAVEWKVLNAADYGAPTHRRRLFLVARRDGEPIVWPEPTHGDPKKLATKGLFDDGRKPWRAAAECIDWSLPCPSIFLTREEGKKVGVKRPLAEATLRRIALAIKRYVLENPRPFLVPCRTHGGGGNGPGSIDDPLRTITCTKRGEFAVVTPVVARTDMHQSNARCVFDPQEPLRTVTTGGGFGVITPILAHLTHAGDRRAHTPGEPLPTVTGAHRGEIAVVAPTLVQTGYGERDGQQPRALDIQAPLGTVVAAGQKHALVAAMLSRFNSQKGGESRCHTPGEPIRTLDTSNRFGVVAANLVQLNRNTQPSAPDEPARTVVSGGNHAALVYSFLTKYHGQGGQWQAVDALLHTVDCTDRFGLVTVTIDGQTYVIVDIGLRMLRPRELALCQGFPKSVILTGTNGQQVARIGNSVSPYVARAIVAANCLAAGVAA